ncbi:alpha/beta hydrolase [Nonomuraea harbinensis]|uniref:Alpha/beta hydrolase n=1 Tax=Nonomuraea harbinensis TaxID=1286938 RepID=A0ABW1C7Z3_9ACTN|nr:alpha/beta hydrolase [Nonomuraea harbinensis]
MIDPAARAILDATNAAPPLDQVGLEKARSVMASRPRPVVTPVAGVVDLATRPAGGVPVRLYRPAAEGTPPVVVFAHGGGWILGSVGSADETCRRLALATGCAVLSVEYRLAPEYPHPAAVQDVLEVLRWLPSAAGEHGVDAGRLLLAGESSGAHVVLGAALQTGAELSGLFLACPPVDRRMDSPSWRAMGDDHIPRRSQMAWMWDLYLGPEDEHASGAPDPAVADLTGLPRTVLMVAEYDPLRDEGLALADRLRDAGVETVVIEARGQIHPVIGLAPAVPACQTYLEEAGSALAEGLPARRPR